MSQHKSKQHTSDVYGGRDPRDIPTYQIREAVRYIHVPFGTLHRWCFGYKSSGRGSFIPGIIHPHSSAPPMLSFWNLAEAYVLSGIQKHHGISFQSIRRAISYVEKNLHKPRPLLTQEFQADGVDLFVNHLESDSLINASKQGQVAIKEAIIGTLKRVDRDYQGLITSIYPHVHDSKEARSVEIDPRRSFGRPVVIGTRVPTETIALRWQAGDSIESLAVDFELSRELIESALWWENAKAA